MPFLVRFYHMHFTKTLLNASCLIITYFQLNFKDLRRKRDMDRITGLTKGLPINYQVPPVILLKIHVFPVRHDIENQLAIYYIRNTNNERRLTEIFLEFAGPFL